MLKLYIGSKNYSSWSMRPWVLLTQAGIAFEEVLLPFDDLQDSSPFKRAIAAVSPTAKVPALVDGIDGSTVVWDSLAIAEYLAEQYPAQQLWPANTAARAQARSICAEMHGGFSGLRNYCGMNIEARLPEMGAVVLRDQASVRADLARIVAMWSELLARHAGPMLFGPFSIADAYYAPVCTRIQTYALPVPPVVAAYVERVLQLPSVLAWTQAALAEQRFVAVDEPYRARR